MKTVVARMVLLPSEYAQFLEEAGDDSLSSLLRRKVGLPPLKRGGSLPGHKKPKPKPKTEPCEP